MCATTNTPHRRCPTLHVSHVAWSVCQPGRSRSPSPPACPPDHWCPLQCAPLQIHTQHYCSSLRKKMNLVRLPVSLLLTLLAFPVRWCLWASTSTACISMPNIVRHDICRRSYAVERGLVVGFCGLTTLLLPTLLSDSQVSISLIIHSLLWTVSRQVKAHVVLTCTNHGVSPNHLLVIVASDRPWTTLTNFEGGLNLLHEADDDSVI